MVLNVSELKEIEEEGRRRASRFYELPRNDIEFLDKLYNASYSISSEFNSIAELHRGEGRFDEADKYHAMYRLGYRICPVARFMKDDVKDCLELNESRSECKTSSIVYGELEEANNIYRKLTGKLCTWLLQTTPREKYMYAHALNDLTACFHRLIEEYEKEVIGKFEKVGKCIICRDADPTLREACIKWDKATEKINSEGGYLKTDYNALNAVIYDGKMEFKVGDAPGHRTHIDLGKETLEYYDSDTPVRNVMKEILSELKCVDNPDAWLLRCEGVTRENVSSVAKKLSAATSMDLRLGLEKPIPKWMRPSWSKRIIDECRGLEGEELEKCAVEKILKEI